ncbi:type II and III secretion system protein family protein [Acidibrevibacterium fodinaquatile]|uniref:type II and III secretion system protein family protein n=1 Tax=Acidibrevibacterium fodinaquatile TaxID=1969806 RepID=UPI000E0CEC73|nr:type II and III secretion system protein family protein [Acidibrevibacterium fodinaquatile]
MGSARAFAALTVFALALATTVPALAQAPDAPPPTKPAAPAKAPGVIQLSAGSGQVIALPGPATSVFAADPKVAEVRPASPTSLFVFGVGAGRTTVAALDNAGHQLALFTVVVKASGFGANEAGSAIAQLSPESHVTVAPTPQGMILSGEVPTAAAAEQAMAIAKQYAANGQKIEDRLSVRDGVQVGLRVRIAEMNRVVVREFGVNWSKLGNFASFSTNLATNPALATAGLTMPTLTKGIDGADAVLDALAQDNLVRILAEPTLVTMSGQTASFLVGGEFPIPIAQEFGQISIQFQQYGVQLAFVPTVLSNGRISLHVRPEVSELTNQGAVQLSVGPGAVSVPALTVRRAETTLQLGSGQSFAIAGLLEDRSTQIDNSVLGLGEIPILGALFRSDSFQRNQTELVIIVTPYIVRPVSDPNALVAPTTDAWRAPNDFERILLMRQVARGEPPTPVHIPGDPGFIVQ